MQITNWFYYLGVPAILTSDKVIVVTTAPTSSQSIEIAAKCIQYKWVLLHLQELLPGLGWVFKLGNDISEL